MLESCFKPLNFQLLVWFQPCSRENKIKMILHLRVLSVLQLLFPCFSLGLEVVLGVSALSLPRTELTVGRKASRSGGTPTLFHVTHLCGVWGLRGVGEQPGLPLS